MSIIAEDNTALTYQKLCEFKKRLAVLKASQIGLVSYDATRSIMPLYGGHSNVPFDFDRGTCEEIWKAEAYTDIGDLIEIKITSTNRRRVIKEKEDA